MLLFGYLGEINVIDMTSSLSFGFIFFGMTFYTIYKNYAINSLSSLKLFYFVLFIWSLYGIAALLTVHHKNNMFNILDIFAKNFFGLYLYYKAKQLTIT
jgi:bacteriorhodopsin